ncbi:transmembrane protein, putative (macronuclear) [Tetrahymena thermophila SB210]|uniref:Transmembrane protein, putative n=1 Tax=Tetrahymena thermophila (strain SB210) TaxID=312017 RepID=Q24CB0_TETTS|nr:transmembrane protein, putative [Tetrahymena thermophila SB210]EAS05328.2 transmembrane protein, putative [Tetrahymena thermophila SB210]|eukprot:XP_001025573.2 transmembrane protein, putative [Tetrahymena thermophila SB210]
MFNKIDIFGSQILLRFKGEPVYHTRSGSFITLLIISFIGFRLYSIIEDVFLRASPQVIYSERQVDNPAPFQISSSTFPLAFGMEDPNFSYYIDEGIYTIQASFYQKTLMFNETTQQNDAVWNITQIQVQRCTLDNFKNPDNINYYTSLKYQNMYCLPPNIELTLQGDFQSPIYSYLELLVIKCKQNCKSQEQLDHYLLNSNFAMQLSDSFVNPQIKYNPFKMYSRDIYWATTTQMPKAVTLYLRNNYVQSDFGWFLPDLTTQHFPAYSYNDVSVFPDNFQNYFLSVVFRFEKQKEGFYSRTYKNFNNIISEIGGFTQSLLAVGYLICTRISQLQLNQTLINQAFSYEDSKNEDEENKDSEKKHINLSQKLQSPNQSQQIDSLQNQLQEQVQSQNHRFKFNQIMKKNTQYLSQNQKTNFYDPNSPVYSPQNKGNQINNDQNLSQKTLHFQQIKQNKEKQIFDSKQFISNYRNDLKQSKQYSKQKTNQLDQKKILNLLIQDVQNSDEITQGVKDQEVLDQNNHLKIQKYKLKIKQIEEKLKENRFNELMKKETKCMKMNIWEYFKSIIYPFGELKKKKQIIQYSIDKLYYNLDIFNILKKLVEVEKLKRLLLDQEQLKLFDYLPKPTIHSDLVLNKNQSQVSIKKSYEVDVLYQDHRTEMQRAKDAFQAYKKIVNKQNHTILDQKIIDLLDPNLVSIFQAEGNNVWQNNYIEESNIEDISLQSKINTFNQQSPIIKLEQIQGQTEAQYPTKQDDIIKKQESINPLLVNESQSFLLNKKQLELQLEKPKFQVKNIYEQMNKFNEQKNLEDETKDLTQSIYSEIAPNQLYQMPIDFQSNQNDLKIRK